jgi:hypothetical protein
LREELFIKTVRVALTQAHIVLWHLLVSAYFRNDEGGSDVYIWYQSRIYRGVERG